jgi:hypothetical protein
MNSHYQRMLIATIILLSIACAQASQSKLAVTILAIQDPMGEEVVLSEETPINVVITQDITSKSANPNDTVNFKVEEDVVVNGHVLIRKDTPAIGSVIHAQKGGYMGKSGKLGIQVESTQTVDGQRLKLRAARGREGDDKTNSTASLSIISPLFLFRKGGEAKIYEGTRVLVYVGEDKRFRVEDGKLIAVTPVPVDPSLVSSAGADAVVYIYRPDKLMGKALEPSVFVDDTELARMDNGRYFAIKLPPGKHLIHLTSEKKGFAIDMGPGQTYYFRVGLEMGMWKGHGKITLEDSDKALPEIKKLKFLGQDKIKNRTLVVELTPTPTK